MKTTNEQLIGLATSREEFLGNDGERGMVRYAVLGTERRIVRTLNKMVREGRIDDYIIIDGEGETVRDSISGLSLERVAPDVLKDYRFLDYDLGEYMEKFCHVI